MTFLEIVQRLHRRGGASGAVPSTVADQSGEALRLVQWVQDADYNVQTKWLNWKFLYRRTGNNFRLTANGLTTPPADLFVWDPVTFFVRESTDDDWQPLDTDEHENVKSEIRATDTGQPYRAIILPDNCLEFEPIPSLAYYLRADYYKKPVRMNVDSSVSPVPEEYHASVILGTALEYFANFEDSPEVLREAQRLMEHMSQLEASQLPNQLSQWTMGTDELIVGTDF